MTRSAEVNSALYFRPPGGCLGAKRPLSNQWYENSRNGGVHTPTMVGEISPSTEVYLARYIELGQGFRYVQST